MGYILHKLWPSKDSDESENIKKRLRETNSSSNNYDLLAFLFILIPLLIAPYSLIMNSHLKELQELAIGDHFLLGGENFWSWFIGYYDVFVGVICVFLSISFVIKSREDKSFFFFFTILLQIIYFLILVYSFFYGLRF